MKLSEELTARGFIHQTSGELSDIVDGEKRTVYFGVDPTADSIHAGNFVGYMLMRHLAAAGHRVIMLAGGATGRIGDPKPDVERPLLPEEEITKRVTKLQTQAKQLIAVSDLEIVNNYDWFKDIKLIDFLRDIGKHFTVNELMKKDAIARRLESEIGLSYTEFAYPLIQGYDFLELYRTKQCTVQVGGSDQWGNIVAGVDLVRRKEQATVYAITLPLVVDKATGKKFGKSEGNAVWLDAEKTSPYQFYQFWLNVSDESVVDYLKLFTLVSLEEIVEIEKNHQADPGARIAQKRLAYEVTKLVHGAEELSIFPELDNVFFYGEPVAGLSGKAAEIIKTVAPFVNVPEDENIIDLLIRSGLAKSKREAREFIENGAVSINNIKIEDVNYIVTALHEGIHFIKRGKKQLCVLMG